MRRIGLLLLAVLAAIAVWLVFFNPRLGGDRAAPVVVAPVAPPAAKARAQTQTPEAAAAKAERAAKAKAAQAKAEALAAQHAAEAAQADALEQNMTPAQNRLNEDYADQVGDTRPAGSEAGDNSTGPRGPRP